MQAAYDRPGVPGIENRGTDAFARDVLRGLSRPAKAIPSAYLYDARGSRLFQQITELDEYYPTRCELEILETHGAELARRAVAAPFRLVELGAGDGRKTAVLLQEFLNQGLDFEYVPVDICRHSMAELTRSLRRRLPAMAGRIRGIVAEYAAALSLLGRRGAPRNFVLFLGSNIGNFGPRAAGRFLRCLARLLRPRDRLLVGFDLKKDIATLTRAYNDAWGVTREFNFNLLDRINRELGGDFRRERFLHHGPYNPLHGRMESWLVSRDDQEAHLARLGRTFAFRPWEGIRVECSYKYDVADIEALAAASGFVVEEHFFDLRRYFADSLWLPLNR